MSYWKTEHFKALQAEWYRRLSDSGFQDHEKVVDGEHELKEHRPYKRCDELDIKMKEAYYALLGQRVSQERFKSETHRLILSFHAEGLRVYLIIKELKRIGITRDRNNVRYVIRKYEMKWGLRKYSKKQLHMMSA